MRACYDCLLSYGNQSLHEQISRHLVRDLMLRLAKAEVKQRPVRHEDKDQPERSGASRPLPRPALPRGSSRPGCMRTATGNPTGSATRWRVSART